jgi:hypothetical protein
MRGLSCIKKHKKCPRTSFECEIMPLDKTIVSYNFKSFQAGKIQPRRSFSFFAFLLRAQHSICVAE